MTSDVFLICLLAVWINSVSSAPADDPKPLECPQNEYYTRCSIAVCSNRCRDLFVPAPCPGVSSDCFQPACVCEEGYLRSDEGVCIPFQQCKSTCMEHEEFTNCTDVVCRPMYCRDKGLQRRCAMFDEKYCRPGCVCKEGYLRESGVCIPEDQCEVREHLMMNGEDVVSIQNV